MFGETKISFVVKELARSMGFVFVVSALVSGIVLACTGVQRRAIVDASTASCVKIAEASNDPTAKEVCATAEELAPFVKMILGSRARAHASGSASVAPAPSTSQSAK